MVLYLDFTMMAQLLIFNALLICPLCRFAVLMIVKSANEFSSFEFS